MWDRVDISSRVAHQGAMVLFVAFAVTAAATFSTAVADDGNTARVSRAVATRYVGKNFSEERAAFAQWQPGDSSRRILELSRQLLFEDDGFLKEPSDTDERYVLLLEQALTSVVDVSEQSSAEAFHLLSVLSYRKRDKAAALRFASRAVVIEPFSSSYHSNLGFFLQASGKNGEARVLYRRARRLEPANTRAHVGLLSLAPQLADVRLFEIRDLIDDWVRRERDESLHQAARTIQSFLEHLPSSLDSRPLAPPVRGDLEPRADTRELEALRRALLDLFPSTSGSGNATRPGVLAPTPTEKK